MELIIIFTFCFGFVFYAHISKKLFSICSNIFDFLSGLIFLKTLFLESSDQLWFKLAAPGVCGGASLVAQMVKSLLAVQETWVWDLGLIPALGRSRGEANGNPLQYSCLENSKDKRAWRATVWCLFSCHSRVFPSHSSQWFPLPLSTLHFLFLDSMSSPFLVLHLHIIGVQPSISFQKDYIKRYIFENLRVWNVFILLSLLIHDLAIYRIPGWK